MNHKELFGKELTGWKLTTAYMLKLEHGLMGFFPAIYADNPDEPVMCIDKELMAEVGKLLTPRRCKCDEFKVLANEEIEVGFDLNVIARKEYRDEAGENTHLSILTRKKFNQLTAKSGEKSPFKWAPGLVGDDMSREEFIETLQESLKQKD